MKNKNLQLVWKHQANYTVSIYNLMGQIQFSKVFYAGYFAEQLNLNSGIYIVQLTENNRKISRKIMLY